ncbi:LON peptidase substrate-binding domain-containing protein, partial [Mycoplasmopsis bovis]
FIPVKKQILLPYDNDEIRVGKANSILAMNLSLNSVENKNKILVTFIKEQYVAAESITSTSMLEEYGVVVTIKNIIENSGVYKLLLECGKAVKIENIYNHDENNQESPYVFASFEEEKKAKSSKVKFEKILPAIDYLNSFASKLDVSPQMPKIFNKDFVDQIALKNFISRINILFVDKKDIE